MKSIIFIILLFSAYTNVSAKVKNVDGETSTDPWGDFLKSEIRLRCNFPCSFKDGQLNRKFRNTYKTQKWKELFELVVKSGHSINRNYYYLGAVAEGLGHNKQAIDYYRLALNHQIRCSPVFGTCNGIKVRKESKQKIAQLKAQLEKPSSKVNTEESTELKPQSSKPNLSNAPALEEVLKPIKFDGTGKWKVKVSTDPITDEKIITSILPSQDASNEYKNKTAMIIRCNNKNIDIYINFDDYLGSDTLQTISRVDKEKPVTYYWNLSTDSQAAFYPKDTKKLLKQLFSAKQFVVRATPYNENPKTLIFDVRGIYNIAKTHKEVCLD